MIPIDFAHRRLRSLALLSLLVLIGCAPIRREDDVTVADPGSFDRLMFGDYWEAHDVPPPAEGRRVAIAGFELEFVMVRVGGRSSHYTGDEVKMHYSEELRRKLPGRLLALWTERLRERGREVVALGDAARATGYARYAKHPDEKPHLVRHDVPLDSAAGLIRATEVRRPDGHQGVVPGSASDALDRELAKELGVDAVLRARFRVGVFRGHATIEEGSLVTISSREKTGRLESVRTLSSTASVLPEYGELPSPDGVFVVKDASYFDAMDSLFHNYGALAIQALSER